MTTVTIPISVDGATLDSGIEETRADGSRATGLRLSNQVSNLLFYLDCDQAGPAEIYSSYEVGHPVRANTPTRDTTNKKFGASSFLWAAASGQAAIIFSGKTVHPGGEGTLAAWFRPSYSGTPSSLRAFFNLFAIDGTGSRGRVLAYHSTDGHIYFSVVTSAGTEEGDFGVWSPVSGTWYHLEFAWSDTNNRLRVFIDGVIAGTVTASGTMFDPDTGSICCIGAQADDTTRNWNGNIDEIEIYAVELHTVAFTPPTAAINPFLTTAPTATLAALDGGSADSTWDMSTIDVFENFEGATVGSVKYKYKATNSLGGGTYNASWLTLAQLQAETDPSGRYLYLQAQFISDGHQRVSLGDGTITCTIGTSTAPTAAVGGRVSAIAATSLTAYLDTFPGSNIDGWRMAYRVQNFATPNTWTYTATNTTVASGATIAITGLTENSVYEIAFQGLNGTTTGDFGEIHTVVPNGAANIWDASEITEAIMTLVNSNLSASNRLNLARNANYGTLRDYPNLRDQTSLLPLCLVDLVDVKTRWADMPRGYDLDYVYRINFAREYATTDDVVRLRADSLGMLVGLFADFRQLNKPGGKITQGQIGYCIVDRAEVRPPEDIYHGHGHVFAVALTLRVRVRARA